jgi:hypothetical protein
MSKEKGHDPLSFLGESIALPDTRETTLKNIKLIVKIRWFISPSIYVIMFASSIFGLSRTNAFSEQLLVNGINLGFILIVNIAYALLIRRVRRLGSLVLFQLLIDVAHFSFTVYKTGGVTSPFAFLYFMVIFSASILVSGKTTYIVAGGSSFLYSLIVVLELIGVLPHQDFFSPLLGLQENYAFLTLSWSFAILSFFAFAALASYLSELLRRRQKKLRLSNEILAKKVKTLLLIYRTGKALNTCKTVREVVGYILSELIDYLKLDRALLYLNIRNEFLHLYMVKERIEARAVSTFDDSRVKREKKKDDKVSQKVKSRTGEINIDIPLQVEAGLTARAAIGGESFNIRNPEKSKYINIELAKKIGMNPFALSPLIIRDRAVGVIGIDRSYKNGFITDEEFKILQMFANQAAITIDSLERIDLDFRHAYGL